ncbi:MAG: hypothetical protein H6500_00920 [Candidatus Woesearchaeota archaeon]|nr:hypothetical protein [Nanoarchaeota archaeon]USN44394.1 MAG: hypothetical protein H6500_00920 [Candidatus Woesearchaeota archaeon]
MELYEEVVKIKEAFRKVKKDVVFLSESMFTTEQNTDRKFRELSEEIEMLKSKLANIEGKETTKEEEIVGNSLSLKFHLSSCPYAKKISNENIEHFQSIHDALTKGFQSCACVRDN